MNRQWWRVKVYHEESSSTTTLDMYANSIDEIIEELDSDGLWTFVSAYPDESDPL
jgi:hypothetical protein